MIDTATIAIGDTKISEAHGTLTVERVNRRRRGRPTSWGGPYMCTEIWYTEGYYERIEEPTT